MLPYWEAVVRPLLEALGEGPIVEIGAAGGETTTRLAELAAELDTTLHSIDPEPRFDVAGAERRFGRHLRFHRERSLDALQDIEAAAAAVIDGDHNWYTVHGELTRLQAIAAGPGRTLPLAILHDVEWPYGRRDMYYAPDAIPSEWRKPWERRGIRWGERRLDASGGGVNGHLANAIEEGGPRNGVLTAVEDFVEGSAMPIERQIVAGHAGLGLLAGRDRLEANAALRREWERLRSSRFLAEHAAALSRAVSRSIAAQVELEQALRRLQPKPSEAKGATE